MLKKITVVLLAVLSVIMSLSSCKKDVPQQQDVSGAQDGISQPEAVSNQKQLNLLTGEYTAENHTTVKRPVSVMVSNIQKALPQYGISQADIIYEALAEGGITRLMAVFSDYTALPKTGPVRSARDYYLDFAAPMDTIFVHWGTSDIAKKAISSRGLDNIDGMIWSKYYIADAALASSKGTEHSKFIDAKGLSSIIEKKQERTTSDVKQTAFPFAETAYTPAGQAANSIRVAFSGSYDAVFNYDEASGQYLVSEFGAPHKDAGNGSQLSMKNVLILFVPTSTIENGGGKLAMTLNSGKGFYASQGAAVPLTWKKGNYSSSFSFTSSDGGTLKINPGKTYVCVVPTSREQHVEIS